MSVLVERNFTVLKLLKISKYKWFKNIALTSTLTHTGEKLKANQLYEYATRKHQLAIRLNVKISMDAFIKCVCVYIKDINLFWFMNDGCQSSFIVF